MRILCNAKYLSSYDICLGTLVPNVTSCCRHTEFRFRNHNMYRSGLHISPSSSTLQRKTRLFLISNPNLGNAIPTIICTVKYFRDNIGGSYRCNINLTSCCPQFVCWARLVLSDSTECTSCDYRIQDIHGDVFVIFKGNFTAIFHD